MSAVPKRRRLSFSLRTLFVVVTVLCVTLGWQLQIVRHRQAMRRQIEADGGVVFLGRVDWLHSPSVETIRPADYGYQISALRRFFGDEPVGLIGFDRQLTSSDYRAIEAIPEAQVHAHPD